MGRITRSNICEKLVFYPPPDATVSIIVEWIEAKETHENNPTCTSFERLQHAITAILNDNEARYTLTQLLLTRDQPCQYKS